MNVEKIKNKRGRPRKISDGIPKEKKKMGRPPKSRTGKMLWCPDFCLDAVQAFIETLRQQQDNQQAKTS